MRIEKYYAKNKSLYKFWFNIEKKELVPSDIYVKETKIYDEITNILDNLDIKEASEHVDEILERNKDNGTAQYFKELIETHLKVLKFKSKPLPYYEFALKKNEESLLFSVFISHDS